MTARPDAVAVILAAGAGRRLGGVAKALLPRGDGLTLLGAVAATARAAGVARLLVVVGPPFAVEVARAAAALGAEPVDNPAAERGMATSVAAGFAAAAARAPDAEVALLWPVDHAWVRAETVAMILAATAAGGAVVPVHDGRGGHPAGFGRLLWPELAACAEAPAGARSVLAADPARLLRLPVDDAAVRRDLDEPADLRREAR